MDDDEVMLKRRIQERAFALWEADGRPEGREWDYWLAAEREIVNQSYAGEEDPLEGLDQGIFKSDTGS